MLAMQSIKACACVVAFSARGWTTSVDSMHDASHPCNILHARTHLTGASLVAKDSAHANVTTSRACGSHVYMCARGPDATRMLSANHFGFRAHATSTCTFNC